MRALVLSDIHSNTQNLEAIVKLLHNEFGLVLLLGDLTQMGGAEQAKEVLAMLKPAKILAFAGNFELPGVQQEIERKGISLHGGKEKLGKWTLVGFGGGLHGNPGAFLFSEAEVKKTLSNLLQGEQNTILLTHLPPIDTKLDTAHTGKHIGSRAVREVIEEFGPKLHLCGHCHEGAGEERVAGTASINVGAVKDGKALLLELGEELKWERVQL